MNLVIFLQLEKKLGHIVVFDTRPMAVKQSSALQTKVYGAIL